MTAHRMGVALAGDGQALASVKDDGSTYRWTIENASRLAVIGEGLLSLIEREPDAKVRSGVDARDHPAEYGVLL